MSLVDTLTDSRGILFAAIDRYDKPQEVQKFYEEYVLNVKSNREMLVKRDTIFLYLKFPEKDRENEIRETAARHLVYALGSYEKRKSLVWRRNIPEVDKFWKEFNKPYSRKLRRKMFKPS